MLYPVERSGAERHFSFEQVSEKQMNLGLTGKNKRRFLIMTMLFVSSRVKENLADYHALLNRCNAHVGAMIEEFNRTAGYREDESVFGEVYGTFNSAEMCILWGADQFTDVQYLVDQIRYLSIGDQVTEPIPLFASSYTIVSMYQSISEIRKQGLVKGGAMIQLASASLRHTSSVDAERTPAQYLTDLNDHRCELYEVEACSGEYDFLLNTRPPRLDLFEKSLDSECQNLHYKNKFYKAHFSSTTTRLYYDLRDIPPELNAVDWTAYRIISGTGIWKNKSLLTVSDGTTPYKPLFGKEDYDEYENLLINSISNVSSMGTNLRLFYSDYMRALHMTPDRQWTKDLEFQVKTGIDALKVIEQDASNPGQINVNRKYNEQAEQILDSLKYQIHHIIETGKFTFEEPCLRANSTVEYDLLFHMFYGAAKEILNCIYDRNKGKSPAQQSTLVPVIKFQPTPIIESKLWFDDNEIDKRLLDITIPYDAWGEPQFFIPYLVHEFYHYTAPVDRNFRNEYFAKFLLCEIYRNTIIEYLYSTFDPDQKSKTLDLEGQITDFTDILRDEILNRIKGSDVLIGEKMANDFVNNGVADKERQESLIKIEKGDANWSIYKEAFLYWCNFIDGINADENNSAGFLRMVIGKSVDTLLKKNKPSDDCAVFCEMLTKAIVLDKTEDTLKVDAELIENLRKQIDNCLNQSERGLREIFPDYAMVTLCDLGIEEYLLLFSVFQDRCFTTPVSFNDDDASTLRVGCIMDLLLKKENKLLKRAGPIERTEAFEMHRESFVKLYRGYCSSCGWSEQVKRKINADINVKANKWFNAFAARLKDYYPRYQVYEKLFEQITLRCFGPLCSKKKGIKISTITRSYFSALRQESAKPMFESSLEAIGNLQPQNNLHEMAPALPNRTPIFSRVAGISPVIHRYDNLRLNRVRWVKRADEMQPRLQSIANDLQYIHREIFKIKLGANGLWYRGVSNSDYGIIPSAMVHFLDQDLRPEKMAYWKKGKNSMGMLWEYQYHLLQRFKYQADGVDEMINSASYTMPDYLALMQHYKQHTCYLDWSEDAFSSLYFALESFVTQDPKRIDDKNDASLFVLDPMLYNRARAMMVNDLLKNNTGNIENNCLKKQNEDLMKEPEGSIIDISLKWNLEKYSIFTMQTPEVFREMIPVDTNGEPELFVKSDKPLSSKIVGHATLKDFSNGEEVLNLPLAVHTSRLNPRIRKQSGQFMVYSYMSRPAYVKDEKEDPKQYVRSADRFDYLALQRIQDYFLETFKKEYPFMYELRIHTDAKEELAAFLRSAGINRFGIYPELDNLKL